MGAFFLAAFILGLTTPASTEEMTVLLPGNVPLVMVRIPAGTFTMGSPPSEPGKRARFIHSVIL